MHDKMDSALTARPLPGMSAAAVKRVRLLEQSARALPQVSLETTHALHAGLYARTVTLPAGVVLTGAEIKIPTLLIISGDVLVYGDEGPVRLTGYHVTLGAAGRKQAFCALADTQLTMLFASAAPTVAAAEREFTDEYEKLLTHREA